MDDVQSICHEELLIKEEPEEESQVSLTDERWNPVTTVQQNGIKAHIDNHEKSSDPAKPWNANLSQNAGNFTSGIQCSSYDGYSSTEHSSESNSSLLVMAHSTFSDETIRSEGVSKKATFPPTPVTRSETEEVNVEDRIIKFAEVSIKEECEQSGDDRPKSKMDARWTFVKTMPKSDIRAFLNHFELGFRYKAESTIDQGRRKYYNCRQVKVNAPPCTRQARVTVPDADGADASVSVRGKHSCTDIDGEQIARPLFSVKQMELINSFLQSGMHSLREIKRNFRIHDRTMTRHRLDYAARKTRDKYFEENLVAATPAKSNGKKYQGQQSERIEWKPLKTGALNEVLAFITAFEYGFRFKNENTTIKGKMRYYNCSRSTKCGRKILVCVPYSGGDASVSIGGVHTCTVKPAKCVPVSDEHYALIENMLRAAISESEINEHIRKQDNRYTYHQLYYAVKKATQKVFGVVTSCNSKLETPGFVSNIHRSDPLPKTATEFPEQLLSKLPAANDVVSMQPLPSICSDKKDESFENHDKISTLSEEIHEEEYQAAGEDGQQSETIKWKPLKVLLLDEVKAFTDSFECGFHCRSRSTTENGIVSYYSCRRVNFGVRPQCDRELLVFIPNSTTTSRVSVKGLHTCLDLPAEKVGRFVLNAEHLALMEKMLRSGVSTRNVKKHLKSLYNRVSKSQLHYAVKRVTEKIYGNYLYNGKPGKCKTPDVTRIEQQATILPDETPKLIDKPTIASTDNLLAPIACPTKVEVQPIASTIEHIPPTDYRANFPIISSEELGYSGQNLSLSEEKHAEPIQEPSEDRPESDRLGWIPLTTVPLDEVKAFVKSFEYGFRFKAENVPEKGQMRYYNCRRVKYKVRPQCDRRLLVFIPNSDANASVSVRGTHTCIDIAAEYAGREPLSDESLKLIEDMVRAGITATIIKKHLQVNLNTKLSYNQFRHAMKRANEKIFGKFAYHGNPVTCVSSGSSSSRDGESVLIDYNSSNGDDEISTLSTLPDTKTVSVIQTKRNLQSSEIMQPASSFHEVVGIDRRFELEMQTADITSFNNTTSVSPEPISIKPSDSEDASISTVIKSEEHAEDYKSIGYEQVIIKEEHMEHENEVHDSHLSENWNPWRATESKDTSHPGDAINDDQQQTTENNDPWKPIITLPLHEAINFLKSFEYGYRFKAENDPDKGRMRYYNCRRIKHKVRPQCDRKVRLFIPNTDNHPTIFARGKHTCADINEEHQQLIDSLLRTGIPQQDIKNRLRSLDSSICENQLNYAVRTEVLTELETNSCWTTIITLPVTEAKAFLRSFEYGYRFKAENDPNKGRMRYYNCSRIKHKVKPQCDRKVRIFIPNKDNYATVSARGKHSCLDIPLKRRSIPVDFNNYKRVFETSANSTSSDTFFDGTGASRRKLKTSKTMQPMISSQEHQFDSFDRQFNSKVQTANTTSLYSANVYGPESFSSTAPVSPEFISIESYALINASTAAPIKFKEHENNCETIGEKEVTISKDHMEQGYEEHDLHSSELRNPERAAEYYNISYLEDDGNAHQLQEPEFWTSVIMLPLYEATVFLKSFEYGFRFKGENSREKGRMRYYNCCRIKNNVRPQCDRKVRLFISNADTSATISARGKHTCVDTPAKPNARTPLPESHQQLIDSLLRTGIPHQDVKTRLLNLDSSISRNQLDYAVRKASVKLFSPVQERFSQLM